MLYRSPTNPIDADLKAMPLAVGSNSIRTDIRCSVSGNYVISNCTRQNICVRYPDGSIYTCPPDGRGSSVDTDQWVIVTYEYRYTPIDSNQLYDSNVLSKCGHGRTEQIALCDLRKHPQYLADLGLVISLENDVNTIDAFVPNSREWCRVHMEEIFLQKVEHNELAPVQLHAQLADPSIKYLYFTYAGIVSSVMVDPVESPKDNKITLLWKQGDGPVHKCNITPDDWNQLSLFKFSINGFPVWFGTDRDKVTKQLDIYRDQLAHMVTQEGVQTEVNARIETMHHELAAKQSELDNTRRTLTAVKQELELNKAAKANVETELDLTMDPERKSFEQKQNEVKLQTAQSTVAQNELKVEKERISAGSAAYTADSSMAKAALIAVPSVLTAGGLILTHCAGSSASSKLKVANAIARRTVASSAQTLLSGKVPGMVATMGNSVGRCWETASTSAVTVGKVSGITGTLTRAAHTGVSKLGLMSGISWSGAMLGLVSTVSAVAGAIWLMKHKRNNISDTIIDGVAELAGTIADTAKNTRAMLSKAFSGACSAIRKVCSSVMDTVTSTASSVWGGIKSIATKVWDAGASIVSSIGSGISAVGSWLFG